MFGDFDGDGKEDLAVVVTGSPALDQGAHNYKLVDPYDSLFRLRQRQDDNELSHPCARAATLRGHRA